MSKKEILAYAITHAPPGVKGGPYEGCGAIGGASAHLGCALRWPDAGGGMWARDALASVRRSVPTARVIRIVRARPSAEPTQQPSEASAVAVLRELVAWDDQPRGEIRPFAPIIDRARRVLAAAGPDPSAVEAGIVPVEVHERGWQWRPTGDDTAFAPPFGTIRACRSCGCLVTGGPTACVRCAEGGA